MRRWKKINAGGWHTFYMDNDELFTWIKIAFPTTDILFCKKDVLTPRVTLPVKAV